MMRLNTLSPAPGSRKAAIRVGRGIGCGKGKTSGRGHKGQSARAGGFHKINFEGGQMPIHRRLPKTGFKSGIGRFSDEVTLSELDRMLDVEIDLAILKRSGLVSPLTKQVKVIASGEVTRAITIKGLRVTKGARLAIETAGGSIEG